MKYTDFPVDTVYIDFIELPGLSTAVRNVRLIDENKSVIFIMDRDHRAEWLALINSGKLLGFWVHQHSKNEYNVGIASYEETIRLMEE